MDSHEVAASTRATYGPCVAPDGRSFAYIADDDGYTRAVQSELLGQQVGPPRDVVLPIEGPISAVRYSPDGHFLACQVWPLGASHSQVWVVTNDPEDRRAWRVDGVDDDSAELVGWDGAHVLVTVERSDGLGESRRIDPSTGEVVVLDARPEARLLDALGDVALVRTGPRSDRSAWVLSQNFAWPLFDKDPGSVTDLAVLINFSESSKTLEENEIRRPIDKRVIACSATNTDELHVLCRTDVGAEFARLVKVTLSDGSRTHTVLAEHAGSDLDTFAVSGDQRSAVLIWNVDGGRTKVQVLDLLTGELHQPLAMPDGVITDPCLNADGSILAFTAQSPRHERSVHIMNVRTGLCIAADPAPNDSRAVEPQLVTFTARDGLELSGWLYLSPGEDKGANPLVIHLHGGPEGQERPGYSPTYPTLLAAGINVFAPNVRGSGGFGRAFVHADDHELRIGSINDVADAAAFLVDSGLARRENIAVAGWSYGGYLTMATLAFHDVACCGIAVSGMSDLRTFHATTQPWISRASRSKYGAPGEDDALMARVAPLSRADAVRVPLLVIHGADDTNVPPSESTQMADAVRAHGGRADIVILDGEGHDFVRHASRDRIARLMRDAVLAAAGTPPS